MNPICHGLLEAMQVFIELGFRRIYYLGMSRTSRTAVCPHHWNLVFLTKSIFFIPAEKWQAKAIKSVLHVFKLTRKRQFFSTCKGTSKNTTGMRQGILCKRAKRANEVNQSSWMSQINFSSRRQHTSHEGRGRGSSALLKQPYQMMIITSTGHLQGIMG